MKSRWIVVALFFVGCHRQDADPQARTRDQGASLPKSDPSRIAAGVSGMINGKSFIPDRITYNDSEINRLSFRCGRDFFAELEISIRLEGDNRPVEGAELNTNGRFEDPWIVVSFNADGKGLPKVQIVQPEDYAMTLKFTKRRKGWVDGTIDLRFAKLENTHLVGTFSAQISTAATSPSTADDAPFVSGQVRRLGDWNGESVSIGIAGREPGGSGYSNHIGLSKVHAGLTEHPCSVDRNRSQRTCIISDPMTGLKYKHVKMPIGEFIVYVSCDGMVADWRKVSIKDDHQQLVDLTVDPSKWGKVVVTISDVEANDKIDYLETLLALVPVDLDPSSKEIRETFSAAEMEIGKKSVVIERVLLGKYIAIRGRSRSVVDVVAGQSVAVLLVRDPPK